MGGVSKRVRALQNFGSLGGRPKKHQIYTADSITGEHQQECFSFDNELVEDLGVNTLDGYSEYYLVDTDNEYNSDDSEVLVDIDFSTSIQPSTSLSQPNQEINAFAKLSWNVGADNHLKSARGQGVRTRQLKKQNLNHLARAASQHSQRIENFFQPSRSMQVEKLHNIHGYVISRIDSIIEELDIFIARLSNSRSVKSLAKADEERLRGFNIVRLNAVRDYFSNIRDKGCGKVQASESAALAHFRKGAYKGRVIRAFATFYYETGSLPDILQGKHIKTKSLIHDEDVRQRCLAFLRGTKPDKRSPYAFKMFVEQEIIPTVVGGYSKKKINESTITRYVLIYFCNPNMFSQLQNRWMHTLGLSFTKVLKGIYRDDHERGDVVAYRQVYLDQMAKYRSQMAWYEGDDLARREPDLSNGAMEIIPCWHDESCFAAYDGKKCVWLQDGEKVMRKKGNGKSIMVSDIVCQCHGPLYIVCCFFHFSFCLLT